MQLTQGPTRHRLRLSLPFLHPARRVHAQHAMHTSLRLFLVSPLFLALSACGGTELIDTLSGTVVDHDGGAPAPNVQVALGDQSAVSDAAGRFRSRT